MGGISAAVASWSTLDIRPLRSFCGQIFSFLVSICWWYLLALAGCFLSHILVSTVIINGAKCCSFSPSMQSWLENCLVFLLQFLSLNVWPRADREITLFIVYVAYHTTHYNSSFLLRIARRMPSTKTIIPKEMKKTIYSSWKERPSVRVQVQKEFSCKWNADKVDKK